MKHLGGQIWLPFMKPSSSFALMLEITCDFQSIKLFCVSLIGLVNTYVLLVMCWVGDGFIMVIFMVFCLDSGHQHFLVDFDSSFGRLDFPVFDSCLFVNLCCFP